MYIPSLKEIDIALARKRYWEYVKYVHRGRWLPATYLVYMCNVVQDFLEDKLLQSDGSPKKILCISMPPQHGKSMALTETLPSWYVMKYKTKRVIELSYNGDFAQKFGRRNREKVLEFGKEIFDVSLSKSTASMTEWELENGVGGMLSVGLGGSVTGNPADLILIDKQLGLSM